MHTPEKIRETHLAIKPPKLLDQVRDRLRVKYYSKGSGAGLLES